LHRLCPTGDAGQDLIEYALLCAALSLALLGILPRATDSVNHAYARARSTMQVGYECDASARTGDARSQCP
jgi:Flp pilus assembly pilin Flp